MAGDYGYQANVNKILLGGMVPPIRQKINIGDATNMYAGRLLTLESTDYDRKVCTGVLPPTGWLGYEDVNPEDRPATLTTIFVLDDEGIEYKGGGFAIKGKLAKGCSVVKGNLVANWADGQVVGPIANIGGSLALGIAFTKKTSEQTTYIELPADMVVKDVIVDVTTNDASGTIDVGLNEAVGGGEVGGDADGFLDGESLATATKIKHNRVDAAAANNTLGALLVEADIKSADGTALYLSPYAIPGHVCDGVAKTITYTTSNHTVAGIFWVVLEHENFRVVGMADQSVNASAAAADLAVLSHI